jgi:glycosyltransferase involved in cell wall biosynthesis
MPAKTKKILRILFAAADASGPSFHDLTIPTRYFHKYNLLQCQITHALEQILNTNADIVNFQRQYLPEVLMYVRMAKQKGQVVTTICDDNVWNLPPKNPASSVYQGIVIDTYEAILQEVHAVTTSTPYLRELCIKHNPHTYIHRNLVEMSIHNLVFPDKDDDEQQSVRIGWHLTPHHADDAEIIKDAVPIITQRYPQVKWIMMGWNPPFVAKLPRHRTEYYGFVPVEAFYPAIASLDIDIGIAPLVDHPFNWGKTCRKAQEYAVLGIPMILAPIRTYDGWNHNETCIRPATNDTKGWVDAISYLIEHPEEHRRLATAAYHKVLEENDIDKWIKERAAVYYGVYNRVKGTNLMLPTDTEWEESDGRGETA